MKYHVLCTWIFILGFAVRQVRDESKSEQTIPQSCSAWQLPLHKGAKQEEPPLFDKGEVSRSDGGDKEVGGADI